VAPEAKIRRRLAGRLLAAFCVCAIATFASVPVMAQAGPTDDEVAKAIARGIEYLRGEQAPSGSWQFSFSQDHELGMTALAGLALMENGVDVKDPAVQRAAKAVRLLSAESNQTYDLSLAILFLARAQLEAEGSDDERIQKLAERLAHGDTAGAWGYFVPLDAREEGSARGRRMPSFLARLGPSDNSNTQFALLGLWAAGRHGFDPNDALEAIDNHFRKTQASGGSWGYRPGMQAGNAMTCAGLMGLAIASARPKLAERQTARARGNALAADRRFIAALNAVARDARELNGESDIYYLWSLERVCVALGLRELEGFDWYAAGARVLLDRQEGDGSWPQQQWGKLPNTCLALLFLRKANLAFELDRVLKLPGASKPAKTEKAASKPAEAPSEAQPAQDNGDAEVVITSASEKFPQVNLEFEVKRADGSFVLDARAGDFRVTESGENVEVLGFQSPTSTEAKPITVVLVVDRSWSMKEEDRIGGMKRAVATFLKGLPEGSRVALIAFGSEVRVARPFTTDVKEVDEAVNALAPGGLTRYYEAVAKALELLENESGRRAVLALTDGEDTSSKTASLESVILAARRIGVPVHTLGLGSEDEIESDALRNLATSTRGQYYPARRADELRTIYEEIASRLKASYTLTYRTAQKIPDGTLRPVKVYYRAARQAGETAVFIPGMVVPESGWSMLFLVLLFVLGGFAVLPGRIAAWKARQQPGT
jgi:VWFA-related protein